MEQAISEKSRMVDAILCWFLGAFGAHKFYEGKTGLGILYIFTFGLFGIGVLVDFIMILCGKGHDSDGLPIVQWLDNNNNSNQSSGVTPVGNQSINSKEDDKIKALNDYKDLLDRGIITQEEFDKKKEDILK